MQDIQDSLLKLPGFKLPKGHFRIGSKIHITDFYYATRFFQNSYYSSRWAFVIARYILKAHGELLHTSVTKNGGGVTLIGYGLYSALLLSQVEELLRGMLQEKNGGGKDIKLNHELVSDVEQAEFIKKFETIHENALVIVPIATTFSTSVKIKEFLLKNRTDNQVLTIVEPYINILWVGHKGGSDDWSQIERDFGFSDEVSGSKQEALSKKEVTLSVLNSSPEDTKVKQRFFLVAPTTWNAVHDCTQCFQKDTPLFYTDKTSVTPVTIFRFPEGKKLVASVLQDRMGNSLLPTLNPDALIYGHRVRDRAHYHYYFRVEKFYSDNQGLIDHWLRKLRVTELSELCKTNGRVVIMAPGHFSNTGFVNHVNKVLFANAANVIHYDSRSDHIQNFELFYQHELSDPDTKVVFVDDCVTGGGTFIRSNYFVKHTRKEPHKGFDLGIVMLDRTGHFSYQNVLRKFNAGSAHLTYHAFSSIHLPALQEGGNECELCLEYKRYERLKKQSYLDCLKGYFIEQSEKLKPKHVTDGGLEALSSQVVEEKKIRDCDDSEFRFAARIEAIHRLFEFFGHDKKTLVNNDFKEFVTLLTGTTRTPFAQSRLCIDSAPKEPNKKRLTLTEVNLLRVLTQVPFSQYQPLRVAVHGWLVQLLQVVTKELSDTEQLNVEAIKEWKFLLRRASILGSNKVIAVETLRAAVTVIEWLELIKTKDADLFNQDKGIYEPKQLAVYFAAQVKQLLLTNEAASIELEKNLKELRNESLAVNQFIRMLHEENGILIENFAAFVLDQHGEQSVTSLLETLNSATVKDTYRYKLLVELLQSEIDDSSDLLKYLRLAHFFRHEQQAEEYKNMSLEEKTRYFAVLAKNLMFGKDEDSGAFFMVRLNPESSDELFLAYNEGPSGLRLHEEMCMHSSYLSKFTRSGAMSVKNAWEVKTIVELHKYTGKEHWTDAFTGQALEDIASLDHHFLPGDKGCLVLTQMGDFTTIEEHSVNRVAHGLLGAYSLNEPDTKIVSVDKLRYILLLRPHFNAFVKRHHENDEFRALIQQRKISRLMMLSGHGREMLMTVAAKNPDVKEVLLLMQGIQTILVSGNSIENVLKSNTSFKQDFLEFFSSKHGILKYKDIESLKSLADFVFESQDIENEVKPNTKSIFSSRINAEFEFNFNPKILKLICFELFVNAKKNRYIFFDGETFNGYSKNELRIDVDVDNSEGRRVLVLKVNNTGPEVGNPVTVGLSGDYQTPKRDNDISGVGLIKQLVHGTGIGRVSFNANQDCIDKENKLYWFKVELRIIEQS